MAKVSVVVPVYNAENYVERAVVSLMEHTLDDIEIIIIDDGSTDGSVDIISDVISRYPLRKPQVIFISRENMGVASTREQGVNLSTGDYIIHLDSDDWAKRDWLEALYLKAVEDSADVVLCNYFDEYANQTILFEQEVNISGIECAKNLLLGKISNANWNKLIKKSIINNHEISFKSGLDMGEDLFFNLCVFVNSIVVSHVNIPLYHYNRINEKSLTSSYSSKSLNDLISVFNLVDSYLRKNNLESELVNEIIAFKMNVKATHISNPGRNLCSIRKAFDLYPELNSEIYSSKEKWLKLFYPLYRLNILFLYNFIFYILNLIKLRR